ncbi:MAG: type IVB secretion system protein IcmH/DotU [Pseudomonadota bacterium]
MTGKNPFEFDDEEERTVVGKPNPSGRLSPTPSQDRPQDPPQTLTSGDPQGERTMVFGGAAANRAARAQTLSGIASPGAASLSDSVGMSSGKTESGNPLIAASARLLALSASLRTSVAHNDIGQLRREIVAALGDYEKRARTEQVGEKDIQLGHYILCALLDDVVMATPWGAGGGWSSRSLTSAFHNQVDSGEKVYTLINRIEQTPDQHRGIIELLYAALSLGFEGKLRMAKDGAAQHAATRARLFELLRRTGGESGQALSGQWRGEESGHTPLAVRTPPWVFWSGFAAFGATVFLTLAFLLDRRAEVAMASLSSVEFAPAPVVAEPFAPEPVEEDSFGDFMRILAPDVIAQRVRVDNQPGRIELLIMSQSDAELFRSASATISSEYEPTLVRVAEAAAFVGGPVFVRGHSDSQPIRTQRYKSNWELSAARAEAVERALEAKLPASASISAEGMGPDNPIADNATVEGRRQNRRVEVILQKP